MIKNKLRTSIMFSMGLLASQPAFAAIELANVNGYQVTTDGYINTYVVHADVDGLAATAASESTRVTSGFLPSIVGLNIISPTFENGVVVKGRAGFYPNIHSTKSRNLGNTSGFAGPFGTATDSIEMREINGSIQGSWGSLLFGKTLGLYQGLTALTGMTAGGLGTINSAPNYRTVAVGSTGAGYLFTNYPAQVRYTSPNVNGFQLAASIADPSQVNSALGITGTATAEQTPSPTFELELRYAGQMGAANLLSWFSGVYQEAELCAPACVDSDVTVSGIDGGLSLTYGNFNVRGSGFTGEGLGSLVLFDVDSLDAAGRERDSHGVLVEVSYKILPNLKLGYSRGYTAIEDTVSTTGLKRDMHIAGAYYQYNANFGLSAELNWHDVNQRGPDLETTTQAVGLIVSW